MYYSHREYVKDPFLATKDVARLLRDGSLRLFLGSGVSNGFGLPNWALLVARLLDRGEDEEFVNELSAKSDKELGKLVDPVDDGSAAYVEKFHQSLYSKVAEDLAGRFSRSPLLLAVAALLTGSCRGRISSVVTYNYDDLLKQYLEMLGYSVCIRTVPSDFSTWADVEINHVHGYLPQSKEGASKAEELVLSEKSYRKRRAFIDEKWPAYVAHCLYSKAGLFLGLSGDDSATLDLLQRAKGKIQRPAEDYHGYWLMTPDAYRRNADAIIQVGMCPIRLEKELFPNFVFSVCQQASHGVVEYAAPAGRDLAANPKPDSTGKGARKKWASLLHRFWKRATR